MVEKVFSLDDLKNYKSSKEFFKELKNTFRAYERGSIERILFSAKNSFTNGSSPDILLLFDDSLMKDLLRDVSYYKAFDSALRNGFVGCSKGHGIVQLPNKDLAYDYLLNQSRKFIPNIKYFSPNDSLVPVKISWHNKTGERIAGVYNSSDRAFFFGLFDYDKSIRKHK